jgi:hypothetical protein
MITVEGMASWWKTFLVGIVKSPPVTRSENTDQCKKEGDELPVPFLRIKIEIKINFS